MHFQHIQKSLFDTEIVQPEDDNALLIPLQYEFLHQVIRLGRVEGNRMVNMQLTNDKLVARGTRMVAEASGLDQTRARELLLRYGSVKKALEHVPESE